MSDRSVTARIKGLRNHAPGQDPPTGVGPCALWVPPSGSVRGRGLATCGATAHLRRFAGDPVTSHPRESRWLDAREMSA
jgi:hypothetical protein